jgi:Zn-dependent peptidase ImmA (M78 family)/DNA-binding XRE family transcriptional regulator
MNNIANPVMITLARESRGKSQTDLANDLGITQAAISKLEKGQLTADGELLEKLCRIFEYPESFFCRNFEIYPPPMQFYRKHKTLPAKIAKKIEAAINIYRLHVEQLLKSSEIDFIPIPECDIDEYDGSAREVAKAVRQYLRLPRGYIRNMTDVIESMGIIIIPFDAGTHQFSGMTSIVNTENYVILVNSRMGGDRLRWTLAHELGHIIAHRMPTDKMEAEADEFASEFLMPFAEIAPELKNLDVKKLAALKRHWKVSIGSIVTTATKTKMLTDWEQRQLRAKLADFGVTRTREPKELDIPVETPSLLNELLEFHLMELGYSIDQLCESFGLYNREFYQIYNNRLPAMNFQGSYQKGTHLQGERPKLSLVKS